MSEHSGYRDGRSEPPGPLADEAARLVGAAQDWWHRTVNAGAGIATGSPECCWCPVCQAIATVRGERPDILERLAETQTALSGLLRVLADTTATGRAFRPAGDPPSGGEFPRGDSPDAGDSAQPGRDGSRIQKIPLNADSSTNSSGPGLPPELHPTAPGAADPEQDTT